MFRSRVSERAHGRLHPTSEGASVCFMPDFSRNGVNSGCADLQTTINVLYCMYEY